MIPGKGAFPITWGEGGFALLLFGLGLLGEFVGNQFNLPKQGGFDARKERIAALLGGLIGLSAGLFAFTKTGAALVALSVTITASLLGDLIRKLLAGFAEAWLRQKAGELGVTIPPLKDGEFTTLDKVREQEKNGGAP